MLCVKLLTAKERISFIKDRNDLPQRKAAKEREDKIIMTTAAAARSKTYDLVYIAVFAVVMAVCSWISIPAQVPFTLQTFGVFMAVGVLGGKRGTMAVLVYVLLGAVGVPVFAGFSGGIGALLEIPEDISSHLFSLHL